jgi:iron complex outermembrane receptor protein
VRHEDYGGQTGATTNPQFRIRWQALSWLAFRGSVGTSFRGPTAGNVAPTGVTGLVGLTAAGGNFKSVDFFGNPAVGPESATTYSVGAIVRAGGLTATIDYWHYKLDDQIVSVPPQIIATAVAGLGNGSQTLTAAGCASPLRALIIFGNGNVCTPGVTVGNDISRVRSDTVNGPSITTDGIDADVNYHYTGFLRGEGNVGGSISYVLHYTQDAFFIGGAQVSPAYEAAGFTNYDRLPGTISRWRGQFYWDYSIGPHNIRVQTTYTDGATDNRGPTVVQTGPSSNCTVANALAAQNSGGVPPTNCHLTTLGTVLGAYTQVDAIYRVNLPWDTTLTLTAQNIFDQEPPHARLELTYDPFIGNALGRTIKIGIRHHF